jgi:hypothetical protein
MRRLIKLALAGALLILPLALVQAAEMKVVRQHATSSGFDLYVTGPIVTGDYDKFRNILMQHGPTISSVELRSPGGNLLEAMKMGRLTRKLSLGTGAPINDYSCQVNDTAVGIRGAPCTCASACFIIFVGGVRRHGLHLIVHRPFFEKNMFAGLSHTEAEWHYNTMLADLREYLKEMNVPEVFYTRMINVPSGEAQTIPPLEATTLFEVPAFDEWLAARCGILTQKEMVLMSRLLGEREEGNNRHAQQLRDLLAKYDVVGTCISDSMDQARAAAYKSEFGG